VLHEWVFRTCYRIWGEGGDYPPLPLVTHSFIILFQFFYSLSLSSPPDHRRGGKDDAISLFMPSTGGPPPGDKPPLAGLATPLGIGFAAGTTAQPTPAA
jgi:hypothetical protein